MNTSSSHPDAHEAILAQFVDELDRRGSQAIDDYLRRYPDLAGRIHDLVQTRKAVQQTRPEPDPGTPERLGEFRILREIGHGGMGRIYEAVQERLNRRVALKVIRHGRVLPEARGRFLREQAILARLHQTNIVAIHTAGEEGPLQYFAMPYIEGAALQHVVRTVRQIETSHPGSKTPSLAQLAGILAAAGKQPADASGGSPPVSTPTENLGSGTRGVGAPTARSARLMLSPAYYRSVAEVLADAAEALHHAHGVGILHRDVKPSNLMVDKSGRCWLIDFGLAGYLAGNHGAGAPAPLREESRGKGQAASREPVTVSGIMGTPQYMAPEQFAGKADVRTDVWGLGATLYELLTLHPAFDGPTFEDIRRKVASGQPTPPRQLVRNVPRDLVAICRKAMSEKSGDRYQTAQEFAEDLKRWLRLEPAQARPAWPARQVWLWARRNKGWAAALFVSLLALIGFTVGAVLYGAAAEKQVREQQYLNALQEILQIRLGAHRDGWSQDAWQKGRDAAKLRLGDPRLRDQLAATLAGLDAKTIKVFPFDASGVAYDKTGKRLLIGGYTDSKGEHTQKAKIWDGGVDVPNPCGQPGSGPVVFRESDGAALQFVPAADDWFTLRLWNLDTQQKIGEFKLADQPSPRGWRQRNDLTLALSADGSLVAASTVSSIDGKGKLVVWDVQSGKPIREEKTAFTALAFSPDSTLLAGGNNEGTVTLWSRKQEKAVLSVGRTAILCLAFGRNPRRRASEEPEDKWLLATGEAGSAVTIWDLRAKQRTTCRGSAWNVNAVAFSPDGTILASAGRNEAKLWDAATGQLLLNLVGSPVRAWQTSVAFSPDARRLAVSSATIFGPGGVDVWELEYGRGIQTLRGLANGVAHISMSPDDRLLAALDDDWHIAIWALPGGRLLHILEVPPGYYTDNAALAFSPNGDRFAFSTGTTAKLWDVVTGKENDSWRLPPGLCDRLAFDATGTKMLLVRVETDNGELAPLDNVPWKEHPRVFRAYDLLSPARATVLVAIKEFNKRVVTAAVPPDGSYFVVEGIHDGADGLRNTIKAFGGRTGKELWSIPVKRKFQSASLAIDPTGKILALHTKDDPGQTLIEMPNGKIIGPLIAVSLSPGARLWVDSPHTSLYRRPGDIPLVTFDIDSIRSSNPLFSASGRYLAWGTADGTINVCDLQEVRSRLATVVLGW